MRICFECGKTGPWEAKRSQAVRCGPCKRLYDAWRARAYSRSIPVAGRPTGACSVCGGREDLTWGHIIPISKGGRTIKSNLRVECRSCNSRAGNRQAPPTPQKSQPSTSS